MVKWIKAGRLAGVTLCVFCLFGVCHVHAFRCGDEIIGTGDSKASVLIKCGKPTFQEKVAASKSASAKGRKRLPGEQRPAHDGRSGVSKAVEKWTYNCGNDDFIYVLTFEGGVVVKVDTAGRGRGASECLGR